MEFILKSNNKGTQTACVGVDVLKHFRTREAIMRYQFQMRLVQQWLTVELLLITLLHYQV